MLSIYEKAFIALRAWNLKMIADQRPDDYVYALMSHDVYKGSQLQAGRNLPGNKDWIIHKTKTSQSGYFGAIYINRQENHIVLAHMGTNSIKALIEDLYGIFFNKISPQKKQAFGLVKEAVQLAKKFCFGLSFTGHALGAFLAELSVFYCKGELGFPDVNAVTFESPGSVDSLQIMQSKCHSKIINLDELDIIGYVSYPNLINTCNRQIGTLYVISNNLGKYCKLPGWSLMKPHSMQGIIEASNKELRPINLQCLKDWPIGKQREHFFKLAGFKPDFYSLSEEEIITSSEQHFKIVYETHYKVDNFLSKKNVLPFKHFSPELQKFLIIFYRWQVDLCPNETEKSLIDEKLKAINVPENIRNYLLGYKLVKHDQLVVVALNTSSDIIIFRRELSKALEKHGNYIKELFTKQQSPELLETVAAIVGPGAEILKGAQIEDVKAIGLKIAVPESTASEDIIYVKKILEQLQNGNSKIKSYIAAPNAKVSGHIKNAQAIGVEIDTMPKNLQNFSKSFKSIFSSSPTSIITNAIDGQKNTVNADTFNVVGQQLLFSSFDKPASHKKLILVLLGCCLIISGISVFIFEDVLFLQYKLQPIKNASKGIIDNQNSLAVPIILNLPPRNNQFTGRERDLIQIHKQLNNQDVGIITQAIAGLGGVGKTQLATEFAYNAAEKKYYKAILWITAETTNSIHNAYKKIADHLQIDIENLNFNDIRKIVHKHLATRYHKVKILIVLDNVHNYQDIKNHLDLLHEQLASYVTPHILITSRSQSWPEAPLILDTFTPEEASIFIKKYLPNANERAIEHLANTLHYFPLALSQAAAYIGRHTNIEDYLEAYAISTQDFLNEFSDIYDQYTGSLWKTWNIILSKLSRNGQKLLFVAAYLEPDDIPIEFFSDLTTTEKMVAIEDLRRHSLITLTNNGKSFKIHRLLQEIIRLTIKKEQHWLNYAIDLIEKNFDFNYLDTEKLETYKKYLENATLISEYAIKTKNISLYRGIKLYAKVAMFKTHILIGGEEVINVWLRLMKGIKEYYKEDCNPLLIASINAHLSVVNRIANKVNKANKANDAKTYAEQAKSIYLNTNNKITTKELELINILRLIPLGNKPLTDEIKYDFGYSLTQLGNIYNYSLHDYQNAVLSYNQSLDSFSVLKNIDLVKYYQVDTLYNLSTAHIHLGNLTTAERLLQATKNLVDQIYTNHRQQACAYTRIAVFYDYIGKFKEAEQLYKEALRIFSRMLSEKHIHIISTKSSLGFNALMSGDLKNAKMLLETTMPYWGNLNDGYWLLLCSKLHLGRLYELLKEYDKALNITKESLIIARREYKDKLLDSMDMKISRAEMWQQLEFGQNPNIAYWKGMLDIMIQLFGENHYQTSRYHCLFGQALASMQQVTKARVQYEKALSILKHEEIKHPNLIKFYQQNLEILQKLIKQLGNS